MKTYQAIMGKLKKLDCYPEIHHDYAEPGYSLEENQRSIITADWNNAPIGLVDALENHFAIEWLDEWTICDECGKLVRTRPNSYNWLPSYEIIDDCELVCVACIRKDLESHIKRYSNNKEKASTILTSEDLIIHGFNQLNGTYENGFHPHQTDTPEKALKQFEAELIRNDYIFVVPAVGQFDMDFELWVRPKNYEHHE
jgi:hypothetical protein